MKLYYKLIIIIIMSIYLAWSVFAINNLNDYGDCRNLTFPDNKYSIYNEELTSIARNNLRSYCCKNKKTIIIDSEEVKCKNTLSENYVDSPRLYDHLIDVGMRYLDGDERLQYADPISNKKPLDKRWKERRDFTKNYGETISWRVPLELQQKYIEYRWIMTEDFGIWESNSQSCNDSKARFESIQKNRGTLSLSKKYFTLCEISSCMVDDGKNNRISACQSLVTQRIIWERNYVQWLLLYQSNLWLSTNFEAYALWYINHDKFNSLLKKIVMMSKWLWFVNSKVNEMTKVCSA